MLYKSVKCIRIFFPLVHICVFICAVLHCRATVSPYAFTIAMFTFVATRQRGLFWWSPRDLRLGLERPPLLSSESFTNKSSVRGRETTLSVGSGHKHSSASRRLSPRRCQEHLSFFWMNWLVRSSQTKRSRPVETQLLKTFEILTLMVRGKCRLMFFF